MIEELVQVLCDPENQPHQWVGDPDAIREKLTAAVEQARKDAVQELLDAQDVGEDDVSNPDWERGWRYGVGAGYMMARVQAIRQGDLPTDAEGNVTELVEAALEQCAIEVLKDIEQYMSTGLWDNKPVSPEVFEARERVCESLGIALEQRAIEAFNAVASRYSEEWHSLMLTSAEYEAWEHVKEIVDKLVNEERAVGEMLDEMANLRHKAMKHGEELTECQEKLAALQEEHKVWDKHSLVEIVEERNELRNKLADVDPFLNGALDDRDWFEEQLDECQEKIAAADARVREVRLMLGKILPQFPEEDVVDRRYWRPGDDQTIREVDQIIQEAYWVLCEADHTALEAALDTRANETACFIRESVYNYVTGKIYTSQTPITDPKLYEAIDAVLEQNRRETLKTVYHWLTSLHWDKSKDGEITTHKLARKLKERGTKQYNTALEQAQHQQMHTDTCSYCSLLPKQAKHCRYCGRPMDDQNKPRYSKLLERVCDEGGEGHGLQGG